MPSETPFPLQGPPPNTLAEVRQHINYWSSRQNEGHLESEWEAWVKNRLDALRWKEQELLMREGPSRDQEPIESNLIFISCGQYTEQEKSLGNKIREPLERNTELKPYFAENQTSLQGLTAHILAALNRSVGFIAVMHHRGVFETPQGKIIRASVWVEQEIAVAAFIEQVLRRPVEVQLYVQKGVALEGMRDKLLLNAVQFETNDEVIEHLIRHMERWKSIKPRTDRSGIAFDSSFEARSKEALSDVFVQSRFSGADLARSPTLFWAFLSPSFHLGLALAR
jgi:hypothetical protein